MVQFSWVYLNSVTDQIHQIPLDWSPTHLMSIPSLRSHLQPTFDHCRARLEFEFDFDSDAATSVGLTRILSSESSATLTPQSLFKKYTTTRLALRCCCAPAVGLVKGMS